MYQTHEREVRNSTYMLSLIQESGFEQTHFISDESTNLYIEWNIMHDILKCSSLKWKFSIFIQTSLNFVKGPLTKKVVIDSGHGMEQSDIAQN